MPGTSGRTSGDAKATPLHANPTVAASVPTRLRFTPAPAATHARGWRKPGPRATLRPPRRGRGAAWRSRWRCAAASPTATRRRLPGANSESRTPAPLPRVTREPDPSPHAAVGRSAPCLPQARARARLAFVFLTYSGLAHEQAWVRFFEGAPDWAYSLWIHSKQQDWPAPVHAFLAARARLISHVGRSSSWCGIGELMIELMAEVLQDPSHAAIVWLSQDAVPLRPFGYVQAWALGDGRSAICANGATGCADTWSVLQRRHADLFVAHQAPARTGYLCDREPGRFARSTASPKFPSRGSRKCRSPRRQRDAQAEKYNKQ